MVFFGPDIFPSFHRRTGLGSRLEFHFCPKSVLGMVNLRSTILVKSDINFSRKTKNFLFYFPIFEQFV